MVHPDDPPTGSVASHHPDVDSGLISADDHMDLCYVPQDLWQSRLARRWRSEAPHVVGVDGQRLWIREDRVWGIYGSKKQDGRKTPFDSVGLTEEVEPDVWRPSSVTHRLEDMDRDSVYAQVIFNFTNWSFEDPQLKALCMAAYNDWISGFCSQSERLIGLGVLPTADPGATLEELQHCIEQGLRIVMFEVSGAGRPIHDPIWDPIWKLAVESATIMCVHIESPPTLPARSKTFKPVSASRNAVQVGGTALVGMSLARVLADVIMGGVLERHPTLRFVLGESSLGWVPFVIERLDFECDNYKGHATGLPSIKPSEQFRRNVYCTFQNDEVGVSLIPYLGEDKVMWASDYPHGDGTYPYSAEAVDRIFAKSSPQIRQKATHDNAQRLFNVH
jgi:uncharacterized protein